MRSVGLPFALLALCIPAVSGASDVESQGQLALETRVFSNDGDDRTADLGLGLFGRLELELTQRPLREKARAFGRLDREDPGRTVFVVEELWAEYKKNPFRLRIGADILNWTATEAFHPADIINARNLDSDLENLEKIGEPMIALSVLIGSGSISAYFFPYYSGPILPSPASRQSFIPRGIQLGETLRMNASGDLTDSDFGPQGAVRFTYTLGDADIGIHAVHHLDRSQPEVLIDFDTFTPYPLFRTVTQVGATYQHVIDALIAKVELGYRMFAAPDGNMTPYGRVSDRDHLQAAVGFEYGIINDNDVESTFIIEGQAIFADETVRRSLHVFQRDALFGYRISLGDIDSSEVLISAIVDLEDPEEIFWNFRYQRRLFETWTINVAGRFILTPDSTIPPLGAITIPTDSDHVRLLLTRHF